MEEDGQPIDLLDDVFSQFTRQVTFARFDAFNAQIGLKSAHKKIRDMLSQASASDRDRPVAQRTVPTYALDLRVDMSENLPREITLDIKEATDEELLLELEANYNAQLRWLLVAICEAYFSLVRDLYAAIGFLDRDFWICTDYGGMRMNEISTLDKDWFFRRTKKLRSADIFKALRSAFPDLVKYESPTYLPNPKFWVLAIQKFRHAIVHSGGRLDKATLIRDLGKAHNYRTNKQFALPPNTTYRLQSLFKEVDGTCQLWLVDERGIRTGTYHLTDRPFSKLVEELSSHACLVYDCATKHFDREPFWDRE